MTHQDKRCGTCKWWTGLTAILEAYESYHLCEWNGVMPGAAITEGTYSHDGTNCPCWTAKEVKDG